MITIYLRNGLSISVFAKGDTVQLLTDWKNPNTTPKLVKVKDIQTIYEHPERLA